MNIRRKSLRLILWGFVFLAYFTPFKLSSISIFMLFTFKFYKDVVIGIFFISIIEFIFLLQSPVIVQNILTSAKNHIINTHLTTASITINYINSFLPLLSSVEFISIIIIFYYITIFFACITFKYTLGNKILKRTKSLII